MIKMREMLWHPTKSEVEDWLDSKMFIFVLKESKGSQLSPKNWVHRYLYSDIHEIFFTEFPIVLQEWLSKLVSWQTKF